MPLSQEETLALSKALITTVRTVCPFSPNIKKFNQSEDFRKLIVYNSFLVQDSRTRKLIEEHIAVNINCDSAICGDLAIALRVIISNTNIPNSDSMRFMYVYTGNHSLL